MGFISKVKQARELGRNLRKVKQEMKEVEAGKHGLKTKARKTKELVKKLRDIQDKMNDWEMGELAKEADKEGKKLDKLITLAEARERVAAAKVSVAEAKERLKPKRREAKVVVKGTSVKTEREKVKFVFSKPTIKSIRPKKVTPKRTALPKRKSARITPKRPKLKR